MTFIVFSLFDHTHLAKTISEICHYPLGDLQLHQFPDKETLVKINTDVKGHAVILVASLNQPNTKLLPLIFAANTLKDLGAQSVSLIAPYLAYMRQDKAFTLGEGITSRYFSRLLSENFDYLLTVDPHLHRYKSLSEIYSIPTQLIHAGTSISNWIKQNIELPLIIGPDQESKQWIATIANNLSAPYVIAQKTRYGDNEVSATLPNLEKYTGCTPVLIDDIISTGKTMISTMQILAQAKMSAPICIGIHAIFAGNAYQELLQAGVKKIVTCNTIQHPSNDIDLNPAIALTLLSRTVW